MSKQDIKRQAQLERLRRDIIDLEWKLVRLRTGRKAVRDTADSQDRVIERIREYRRHGQRIVAAITGN